MVSEGSAPNDGPVVYAIARRPESTNEVDLRRVTWSFLKVSHIVLKPEYDLAILEVDPHSNEVVANKLNLTESKPLTLSLDRSQRSLGSTVTWLTTAAEGDLTLTPRLFTGSIVANYIQDEKYSYQNSSGTVVQQTISGARMLEIDKLFLPGASGSPILNAETRSVIGYVHGYRAFALNTNIEVTENAEVAEDSEFKKEKLKHKLPLVTSISVGIDLRTAEGYLTQEGYIAK